jgi:hypothetical protein
MSDDSTRWPAPGAAAEASSGAGTSAPHLLLDVVRRLRARERGYLADSLHDGPIQNLAAASLELAEARRVMGITPCDELGVAAQQVDAAGRSLRDLQDELWPFPRPASGLATALNRRAGWLLPTPLAVDAGAGAAGLPEAEVQVVADVVELILGTLVSAEAPAPARALVAVRADEDLIVLEMTMTLAPGGAPGSGPASGDPAVAEASLRSLAAAIQAAADIGLHGGRVRVRLDIPRKPRHRSGLGAAASARM